MTVDREDVGVSAAAFLFGLLLLWFALDPSIVGLSSQAIAVGFVSGSAFIHAITAAWLRQRRPRSGMVRLLGYASIAMTMVDILVLWIVI